MSTKKEPGSFDCYSNALPDEPMFVLLARDPNAPALVEQWAVKRSKEIDMGTRPPADREQVLEAFQTAREMKRWRQENAGQWKAKDCKCSPGGTCKGADLAICPWGIAHGVRK